MIANCDFLMVVGIFHLFANNVHCKRIFFGGCHDSVYASALATYVGHPLIAPRIILLGSGSIDDYYRSLHFDVVDLSHLFRPISSSAKDYLPISQAGSFQPGGFLSPTTTSLNEITTEEAVAKWQEAAEDTVDMPLHQRPLSRSPNKSLYGRKSVLLNVDNERVDPPPKLEEVEVRESMLNRAELQRFCSFYHLRGYCPSERTSVPCKYRHHPALNEQECDVLETWTRRLPCKAGSVCHSPDCMYGHVCQSQPGCAKGPLCRLACFHQVDKTAVKVWRPSKSAQYSLR